MFYTGIFEVEDRPEDNPDDEILNELRKKQQELKAISQHNLMIAKRLYKHAKEEMSRQELRKKMAVADAEVGYFQHYCILCSKICILYGCHVRLIFLIASLRIAFKSLTTRVVLGDEW